MYPAPPANEIPLGSRTQPGQPRGTIFAPPPETITRPPVFQPPVPVPPPPVRPLEPPVDHEAYRRWRRAMRGYGPMRRPEKEYLVPEEHATPMPLEYATPAPWDYASRVQPGAPTQSYGALGFGPARPVITPSGYVPPQPEYGITDVAAIRPTPPPGGDVGPMEDYGPLGIGPARPGYAGPPPGGPMVFGPGRYALPQMDLATLRALMARRYGAR